MAPAPKLKSRYEIKERLPKQGAMGVVYKAWDLELKRFVAIKTIGDVRNRNAVEHFRQECGVLAGINHANIVDIYDIGEMEDGGEPKPFFVMPFLPGQTLEQLMLGRALQVDQVVEIASQVCRGLQAAHERGVVHRDLKPSNIFVDDAGSVKIIDFGIAHLVDNSASVGLKGTLLYMSPEQIQLKPLTATSDIFSLAVVCYEALTGQRPFDGATQQEIAYRILHHTPPSASELNSAVNPVLGQVIHAAMSKQSRHRFASAREFSDALQKALHNRPIERFDARRVEPRIRKAQKALSDSQYDFAADLVAEMESEGHLHPEIRELRRHVDLAIKQRGFRDLLQSARKFFEAEEYALAMQKIRAVLDEQPDHAEARTLSFQVEEKWNAEQRAEWVRLAREHMENQSFGQAKEALDNVLKLRPTDTQALHLMSQVSQSEEQFLRTRRESAELFQSAKEAFARGEISSALHKAAQVLELDRISPDKTSPDLGQSHLNFFNLVRSESESIRNALEEANRLVAEENFQAAFELCDRFLSKYPQDPQFRALRIDVDQKRRQHLSALIARIDRQLEAEPDLSRRVSILEEVLKQWPREEHFQRALQAAVEKRDLVNSIAQKALALEEKGQHAEAISQWETLRAIYPGYPGLELEIERVAKRRDQQARVDSKNRVLAYVDRLLDMGNYTDAIRAAETALADFSGDAELTALVEAARERQRKAQESASLLEEGQRLFTSGDQQGGLDLVVKAYEQDKRSVVTRAVLVDLLVRRGAALQDSNPEDAHELVKFATDLDPSHAGARNLQAHLKDRRQQAEISAALARARSARERGDRLAARQELVAALQRFPGEPRLAQVLSGLDREIEQEETTAILPKPVIAAPSAAPTRAPTPIPMPVAIATPPPQPAFPPASPVIRDPIRIGLKHWFMAISIGVLLAMALGAIVWRTNSASRKSVSSLAAIPLRVETTPQARIFVDGAPVDGSTIELEPRDQPYSIDARLPGYRNSLPVNVSVTSATTSLEPLRLELEPLPTSLLIVSAMNAKLNGAPVALTEPVQLSPGSHKIELFGTGGASLAFDVEAGAGKLPVISNIVAKQLSLASVVTTFRSEGHVYVRPAPQSVSVDGGAPSTATEEGLPLQGLAPSEHTLVFGSANPHVIAMSDAPAIYIYSSAGEIDTGFLSLTIPHEGAQVTLQGPTERQTQVRNGRVAMSGLKAGEYTLTITADGFDPRTDKLLIEKGKQFARHYELAARQKPTRLSFTGLPAGTEVLINDQPAGVAGADGSLELPNIAAGRKQITLRHPRYETKSFAAEVASGENNLLGGDRTNMAALGSIRINNAPPGSRISFRPKGSAGGYQEVKENPFFVRQGEYEVVVRADRFQDGHVQITVFPGKPSESAVSLNAVAVAAPAPSVERFSIEDFQGKMTVDKNGWHVANNAKLIPVVQTGTLLFTAQMRGGFLRKSRARWSLRATTGAQCIEYELTNKQFGAGPCGGDGKKMEDHGLGESPSYRVQIQFQTNTTSVRIAPAGGTPKQFDSRPAFLGGSEFRLVDAGVKEFEFQGVGK